MLTSKISSIINKEKEEIWSWIPVFLGIGIILSLFFSYNQQLIFFAISLLFFSILFFYFDRFSYRCFIYALLGFVIFGFLWAAFYHKNFISSRQLSGKVYADVKGKVIDVREFENPINHKKGFNLLIEEPVLYKSEFKNSNKKTVKKTIIKKKKKPKKKPQKKEKKMTKKFLKLLEKCEDDSCRDEVNQAFLKHEEEKEIRRKERKIARLIASLPSSCEANQESQESLLECLQKIDLTKKKKAVKKRKISEKQIEKNFLNLSGYQEIDRKFLSYRTNYQQVKWRKEGERYIFPNPPKKISLLIYSNEKLNNGDIVFLRAALDAPPKKEFIGDFDYSVDAAYKRIGGYGHGYGKLIILRKYQNSSFDDFIDDLRAQIATKIKAEIKGDEGAVATALLVGTPQSLISKEAMLQIRNSGLAHLLSISGLHMAIAASIFFVSIRFLLSYNQYLTLHFNIKKIAALIAIFSSYFYLELADSPVPAVRSFIMVALVLLAVIFDLKADAKRSLALAAFILILVNPYNVFSVSFQLSFMAILALLWLHEWVSKLKKNLNYDSLLQKFLWYFLEIILASIVVQIATMPFLIYHFRNFSTYGLLSNMVAIPLTTFITMPLGFLSILLMPFGLEKFTLYLTGVSISWLLQIAEFVTSLKYSYFITAQMSQFAFVFAVIGLFITFLIRSNLKWFGLLIFTLSLLSLIFVKKPSLLFDSKQKFFAIYNEENGLVFSKNIRSKFIRENWMNFMNEKEFKDFTKYPQEQVNCDKRKCEINVRVCLQTTQGNDELFTSSCGSFEPYSSAKFSSDSCISEENSCLESGQNILQSEVKSLKTGSKKKILVLFEREKIAEICDKNFDVIVNMTRKYALPQCFSDKQIVIDNFDFLQKGGYYFYFEGSEMLIRTAR
ncbi:MAG: ComEC/Rec2 family competence protein [Rickettsiales bacterium]|nr:ComEC/Rec2 family competence protein [Rickettsiales bacterium]